MKTWNAETVDERVNSLQFPSVGDACGFSWQPCWACRSPLGGDRFELHYVDEGEVYHEEICVDCAMYIANGEIPADE